ncbi:prepilin peptidase [Paeniglutamicibacter sp. Y32M11]|uniref:prepilin peptidase n=1 Tax=Paeniglutamicibacter sp. Y32M11 TaxID=2853258 RepID=UPI00351CBDF2
MPQQILQWFAASTPGASVAALMAALALVLYLINAVRLSIIDFRSHLLPNRILGPWFAVALVLLGTAALFAAEPAIILRMLLGAGILFATYLLLHLIVPAGMGLGDVKLAAVLGLYLGFLSLTHLFWGTAVAFMLGGVVVVRAAVRSPSHTSLNRCLRTLHVGRWRCGAHRGRLA